ncbi:hypothetical protein HTSR_1059 [Halodesulfurarchaeum formicicum]|uniref:Lipoprotein n=1 Tax=Halodesulfurarchaeum formicicum TaxID=1873524 RepID=A0A1D8S4G3_9EURY|nr:hypothetical protein [Halodesulfurarchaeum formicicum]AOW80241.1 hypothetical protein HTSR_1059 [Halodesulfurarchaeum formicicum]
MNPFTRREALAAVTTGLVALAGCTGSREVESEPDPDEKPVDFEFQSARLATGEPIVEPEKRAETTVRPQRARHYSDYLATAEDLDAVDFATNEAATKLRDYARETNFETESIFLWISGVDECHEIVLRQATVDDDGDPHLDFCRAVRSADVACSSERTHTVGFAVRLPVDGRGVSGHGSGMSSRCRGRPDPTIFDGTVTVQSGDAE